MGCLQHASGKATTTIGLEFDWSRLYLVCCATWL